MKYAVIFGVIVLSVFIELQPARCENLPARAGEIKPIVTTSELVVGTNRFAFGLLKNQTLLEGADVTLRVYGLAGSEATLSQQLKVPYHPIGSVKQRSSVHRHSDGREHVHSTDSDVRGIYVTHISFSRTGDWGIELLVKQKSEVQSLRFAVTVETTPSTRVVGSGAPRSRNVIARDVKDLREIDTSPRPDPRLHQTRIVDAITQGKPQLIVFATPQFCTTRMCGPVVDIVRTLLPSYGKRVAFIHQEIWEDFATKTAFRTVDEWGLRTEPWVFIVDGHGTVRSKFEGLVTVGELKAALEEVLKQSVTRRQ